MILRFGKLKSLLPDLTADVDAVSDALTLSGSAVDRIEKLGDDATIETDITTNRPDLLSYVGIAREIAALFDTEISPLSLSVSEITTPAENEIEITISDPVACPRYTGRVLRGVTVSASPDWLKAEVEACGIRSINNVVDITNLVLLELGHPLHAFDLKKLSGPSIDVRRPHENETLTTLDGIERKLHADDLVIADGEHAVALAGVMGGADTEIGEHSTDILLESAFFDPLTVRRMAKRHNLRTEASVRFERHADISATTAAIDRAAAMIIEIAGGEVLAGRVDVYPTRSESHRIKLRQSRIKTILGIDIARETAHSILEKLGFTCTPNDDGLDVEVPLNRADVTREIDLIEEVGRLHGYDHVVSRLPASSGQAGGRTPAQKRGRLVAEVLCGAGWSEAVSVSMVEPSREILVAPDRKPVAIRNPLSDRHAILRTTVVGGLLDSIGHNLRHGLDVVRLYETAHVFVSSSEGSLVENSHLGLVMAHRGGSSESTLLELKGTLELLATSLRLGPLVSRVEKDRINIIISGESWGHIATVQKPALEAYDIDGAIAVSVAEVNLAQALEYLPGSPRYRAFSRFPATSRDISLFVKGATYAEILQEIEKTQDDRIEEIRFIERYHDRRSKRISIALRIIYRHATRTLEADEVTELHSRIIRSLEAFDRVELRVG